MYKSVVVFTVINDNTTTMYEFNYGDTVNLNTDLAHKAFSGFSFDGFTIGDDPNDEIVTSITARSDQTFRAVYHRISASAGSWHPQGLSGTEYTINFPNYDVSEFGNVNAYVYTTTLTDSEASQKGSFIRMVKPSSVSEMVVMRNNNLLLGKGVSSITYTIHTVSKDIAVSLRFESFTTEKRFK